MSIKKLISQDKFYHYFQPIYDIKNQVTVGYEGLLRSQHHSNPEITFNDAKKEKQLYELDSWSIHKAILTYKDAGFTIKDGNLFLNVFPSTLLNNHFEPFINKIMDDKHLVSQQIVLEISELEKISDFNELKNRIYKLKNKGFMIAIDDLGKGNADFRSIIEIAPDYIKLDRYFSYKLFNSKKKQTIIQFFLNYCEKFNSKLILEGIENAVDMKKAKSLGIAYVQGFFFGKPDLLHEVRKRCII